MVDGGQAEATVKADRERIVNKVELDVGMAKMNSLILGAINGAYQVAKLEVDEVLAAACGEEGDAFVLHIFSKIHL